MESYGVRLERSEARVRRCRERIAREKARLERQTSSDKLVHIADRQADDEERVR